MFTGRSEEARDVVLRTASELPPELEDVRRRLEAMGHMTVFFGAGAHDDLRRLDAWRDPDEVLGVGTLLLMAMAALEWSLVGGTAGETAALATRALADGRLVEVDDNLIYVAAAHPPGARRPPGRAGDLGRGARPHPPQGLADRRAHRQTSGAASR